VRHCSREIEGFGVIIGCLDRFRLIFELFYPLNEYYIVVHGNTTKDEHQHFRRKRRIELADAADRQGPALCPEAQIGAALADLINQFLGDQSHGKTQE
jgi:hypothetical protein